LEVISSLRTIHGFSFRALSFGLIFAEDLCSGVSCLALPIRNNLRHIERRFFLIFPYLLLPLLFNLVIGNRGLRLFFLRSHYPDLRSVLVFKPVHLMSGVIAADVRFVTHSIFNEYYQSCEYWYK
jgi:hypothetical protein